MVPLAHRLGLGAVLGYMLAGIAIGPFALGLINDAQHIYHLAEFGVVMMLFLIGLEIEPERLWRMRRAMIGLGGAQVTSSIAALTLLIHLLGLSLNESLVLSSALALSSTALVLQMLEEKGLMHTSMGEHALGVLIFQDIAVIPLLVLLPMLATIAPEASAHTDNIIAHLPSYLQTLAAIAAIGVIVVGGRVMSRHLFGFIARAGQREVFTAISLALVVGITLLMQSLGISPALGAFIAGVVLANSEYKHTLQADIRPFKGLLLGLFFISVGMSMDFDIIAENPIFIGLGVLTLMSLKAAILLVLARLFRLASLQAVGFALALCQGGEFAFVLLQFSRSLNLITPDHQQLVTMIVACSMALTPLLMILYTHFIIPRFMCVLPAPDSFDTIDAQHPIILAGYGRFGQIIGRFLRAQGVDAVILEKDPEQIDLLRKFGFRGYYGDASDMDLLRSAGAEKARMLIISIANMEECSEIAEKARTHFPHLKIYARARNRRHGYELDKIGVDYFRRDVFDSALTMAKRIMTDLGFAPADMARRAKQFSDHDEATLRESFAFFEEEDKLIAFSHKATEELERLLKSDEDERTA